MAAVATSKVWAVGHSANFLPVECPPGESCAVFIPKVAMKFSLRPESVRLWSVSVALHRQVEDGSKTDEQAIKEGTFLYSSEQVKPDTYIIAKGEPLGQFIPRQNPYLGKFIPRKNPYNMFRCLFRHRRLLPSFCSSLMPFFLVVVQRPI
jgi:hypothetical protein